MSRPLRLILVCLLVLLSACSRDNSRALPQIAVLRFENLSGDPSLDWMGRGFSEILTGQLQGSPLRYAIDWRALHAFDASLGSRRYAPGVSAESTNALVAGANGIVYGYFSVVNQTLRVTAVQEDLATHKMARIASASGPLQDGIFPVAGAIARQLGGERNFGTRNQQALHGYVAALEAADPATASRYLAEAAAADPDFGRIYVFWLDIALTQRNRADADRILELARAHRPRFSPLDRAALDLSAATLHGDFHAQLDALREETQLDPANPNHHRALAQALAGNREYDAAVVEFRRGLSLSPDDIVALNSMGYAAAYGGDLPTAIRVLRAYELLRPKDPNPLDSLGDVHFALGHFPEAEKFYLAAGAKAPAFLNGGETLKAAQARLMTGDVAAATTMFNRYLEERQAAHDPNTLLHRATWLWQTGARRAALASLDREARPDACVQAAIWLLELGDRTGAAAHARRAMAGANSSPAAVLAAFLAEPDHYPAPTQSPLKEFAHAYALLFAKDFHAAVPALQELYRHPTTEPDDGLAVLLAWAYEETGDFQHAEPLLRLTPLPQGAGLPLFASLYFPRLLFLRGAVLERQGHRDQAARYLQLFNTLSRPDH